MTKKMFEICKRLSREAYNESALLSEFEGWKLIGTFKEGVTKEPENGKKRVKASFNKDFFCIAYKKANEIVIAYQGTDIKKTLNPMELIDVITDCNFVIKTIPPSSRLATKFYKEIKQNYKDAQIYLTGHSLGGAYAQMVAARAIRDGDKSIKAFTFNAPGLGYALKKKEKEEPEIKKYLLTHINNYVVMNDFIGNFREHLGGTYYIQPFPLNVPKKDAKGNISPHSVITDYTLEKNGEIISCPQGWNSKCAWAIWVYDKLKVSKAEEVARELLDKRVSHKDLIKALSIIKKLQIDKKWKMLNDFNFQCRRKNYSLISNKEV